jgi:translation elongation factor EF-Tu-like GTPase
MALDLRMELVGIVSSVFAISGRGIGVLFAVSPDSIAHVSRIQAVVVRPDGSCSSYSASREFCRKIDEAGGEVVALVVRGVDIGEIPVGSTVFVKYGAEV